ncbi:MAG: hypothetical protein K8R48_01240 [Alphaproteobacteria bacterium]|nr:hypothetical protein [Alphaproteobacteria bacterium]
MALPGKDPFDYSGENLPHGVSLSEEVMDGDIQAVRKRFDTAFWQGWKDQPGWRHLKLALQREDKPMLKLLITWGARAADEDLAKLRAVAKDKYPHYIKLLRQSGLHLPAAVENIPYVEPGVPVPDAGLVPQEWKRVLRVFQDRGAEEAMIAGGALRDLFNNRAIKDVDIFLKSRGSEKKNREFLKDVFHATELRFTGNCQAPDYTLFDEDLPSPDRSQLSIKYQAGYDTVVKESRVESWTVTRKETEYNVVFVDNVKFANGVISDSLSADRFRGFLTSGFDLGLCQIAYDGKEISRTSAYDNDVKYRQITLHNPNDKSREHLQRIFKKYSDWELCEKSRRLLAKKPPSGDEWMMYSWSGWR